MLKFGVIGSGWITDAYIEGAKDSGLWELTAIYSRTVGRAEEYARKHRVDYCFTNMAEMAKSDVIDAVYIASPNMLHFEHAKLFLENGKHVICEKPLSAQADKVEKLFELAEKNNLIFLEAIMFMHLPQRKIFEEALAKLGDINYAKIDFCQRSSKMDALNRGETPNIFNPELETGAFMDLGVYCIYPALYLFGLPKSYTASAMMLKTGADAAGTIVMDYKDKQVVISYSKIGQAIAGSEFQGANGTMYVDSISRIADAKTRDNSGNIKTLLEAEEKSRLMGYESIDFHRFITNLDETKEEYLKCKEMSILVSAFMESCRKKLKIRFVSDNAK